MPIIVHLLGAAIALAFFMGAKSVLDQSYVASGHPVDYATGQLAFSAAKIVSYYSAMQERGTLGIYWRTQFIDFSFIFAVALMGLFLGTLAARVWPEEHLVRRWGKAVPILAVAGAAFDAIENLFSFWMLTVTPNIPHALAVVYSSAAAAKFTCLTLAMFLFAILLPSGIIRLAFVMLKR